MIKTIKVDEGDSVLLHGLTEVKAFFPEEGEDGATMAAGGPNLNYLSLAQIQKNSTGANVAFAQKQMLVYIPSEAYYVVVDGVFGAITEDAVKAFQKKCGLAQDGVVGVGTWPRLGPNVYSNMAKIGRAHV
jgi:peptidoglycan hydrolase-like protein with peptidoglycan-binding domain